jgi:hypothetical protein
MDKNILILNSIFNNNENIQQREKWLNDHVYETEHPLFSYPCISIHICGLTEKLYSNIKAKSIINDNENIIINDISNNNLITTVNNHNDDNNENLYLLNWFSRIGRYIGLPISMKLYIEISKLLQ